jgi:hypothetical protein
MLDKSYQDVAFFAAFRCEPGCKTGVLLRAQKTADGGLKGIFVSLNEGDLASYRLTTDAGGNEISREPLRPAGGGQVRVAPPPPAPGAPAAEAQAQVRQRFRQCPEALRRRSRAPRPVCERASGTPSTSSSTRTSCGRSSTTLWA